ncbi:hypothetical protein [Aeoliella sp.]|uniref:hypothetical protein n=1 Tax=Aeoliella sp. TaxID=2795800 RepID=UPI003CCBEA8F
MATHYVYDDPDAAQLFQGDVLKRTDELTDLLRKFHRHYADHDDYKFFSVLTQTCDLVRRDGKPCKAAYLTIAAARTLEETLIREAAKKQSDWQKETKVVGVKQREELLRFLEHVIDNNEPGYFYLHEDQTLGIHRPCCVVLALSVALRAQHYDLLLRAKIAQIKDTFQAKLGWLVAQVYGRVGTPEWNQHYTDNPLHRFVKAQLDRTLASIPDEKIKEGMDELRSKDQLAEKSPEEIFSYIRKTKLVPRRKKFEQRASEVGKDAKLINPIQGRLITTLKSDGQLENAISSVLEQSELPDESKESVRGDLVKEVCRCVSDILVDESFPDRQKIVDKFIAQILNDAQISGLLK